MPEQKVQYQIEITQTGSGGAAAAAELKQVEVSASAARAALASTSTVSAAASGALNTVTISSGQLKTAARALSQDLKLLAIVSFPQVAGAGFAAEASLKAVATTSKLLGVSTGAVAGSLALLTPIIMAGKAAWDAYAAGAKEAESNFDAFVAGISAKGSALDVMARLSKQGAITDFQKSDFYQRLGPQKMETQEQFEARLKKELNDESQTWAQYVASKNRGPQASESDADYAQRVRSAQMELMSIQSARQADVAAHNKFVGAQGVSQGFERGGMTSEEGAGFDLAKGYAEAKAKLIEYGQQGVSVTDMLAKLDADYAQQLNQIHDDKLAKQQQEADKESASIAQRIQQEAAAADQIRGFQDTLMADSLSNEDRVRFEAMRTFQERLRQIEQLSIQEQISGQQEIDMINAATAAYKKQNDQIKQNEFETSQWGEISKNAVQSFASGFSHELVQGIQQGHISMQKFFSDFLAQMAESIMQAAILRTLFAAFGGGQSASFLTGIKAADGGVFPRMMAMGGIASVSSPTFFPRFNAEVGEAGTEWLTVLSHPKMMQFGGMQAAVGNAGGHQLAISSAKDLAKMGGGGAVIEIRPAPGYEASLISNSIHGATIQIVNDMHQDTPVSRSVKRLVS